MQRTPPGSGNSRIQRLGLWLGLWLGLLLVGMMVSVTAALENGTTDGVAQEAEAEDGAWTIGIHVLDLRDETRLVERIRARFEAPLREMERL